MWFFIVAFVCLLVYYNLFFNRNVKRAVKSLPGPRGYPILGDALMFVNCSQEEYLPIISGLMKEFGERVKVLLGPQLILLLSSPEDAEVVLSQNEFSTKSEEYYYLQPWLGQGLLTSSGEKWRKRRKVITPSFHFKILENFLEVFHKQSDTFVEKLKTKCDGDVFDIYPYITLCAMDIICETSMGSSINAQMDSESEYVKAVQGICEIINGRMKNVWKRTDLLFRLSDDYKLQKKYLEILHGFTDKVIQQRKFALNNNEEDLASYMQDSDVYGQKRKMAFLDMLLLSKIDGEPLSDLDIREEVDTFLFEGHDTVSSAIGFAIHELSKHPEIQEKLFAEQKNLFENNEERAPTYSDLQDMKYLEMVIKETLRLHPSVPIIGRTVTKDTTLRGQYIPKNTSIVVFVSALQKNPKYFPEPEKFIPERFLPEESNKRNPFSTVFFSAGPRNCIGQKFAMLELKSTLSKIVRNFVIEPSGEGVVLLGDLIMKSKNGINVKLRKR